MVDEDSTLVNDTAISVTGAATLTMSSSSISGASGDGFVTAAGSTATFTGCTFDSLEKAIDINGAATVTVQGCTISNSKTATVGAIEITAATAVAINGNTFTDNAGYTVDAVAPANVTVIGNNFNGNAKGLRSQAATLNAILNWWGNASGPTISTNVGGTGEACSSNVTYKPWARASTTSSRTSALAAGGILDASATVGVAVTDGTGATTWTVTKYAGNPATSDPTYTPLADAFFDVYAPAAAGTNVLQFYATGITSDTKAYVWSPLQQAWVACSSQGVAGSGEYVYVNVTATSTPSTADLKGTPFVLVAGPAAAVVGTPTLVAPAPNAENIPLRPAFQWTAVTGATGYQIQIADNYKFSGSQLAGDPDASTEPMVSRIRLTSTVFSIGFDLEEDTTYYWRVRAESGKEDTGAWATGSFHTREPEPEPIIIPPAPEPEPQPTPIIELPTATTPAYIWVIIGIGALLLVVVIVLIVRTRRPM
jgi:hypothetical protein